ncbi:MAG: hypothetical protein QOH25_679 [Acidobacteriota bacterium]|jgi:hypothetical protein|nr:hypothetical protein [Acidobacteriota bacterium]
MAEKKKLIITTSGDRPLSAIKKDLAKRGFAVGQVLKEIGIITGTSSAAIEKLRAIPGVDDVSPDESVDIGPPDAPVM